MIALGVGSVVARRLGLPAPVVLVLLGALLSLVPGLTGARLWVSDYGYDQTLYAFDKATGKLGVDQL